jgi:DNA repair protein RecN (Recombination protein N)
MLRFLRIRNLAVIEHADVEFGPGLNVLTGETGAGKSMLVDAVALLLGARAAGDLVRTGETLATVEALFETRDGTERVVRREVTSQGRSRVFLDGQLSTVAAVREATRVLVELHGQHEHQALLDPATHLPLLDHLAGHETPRAAVAAAWDVLRGLRERQRARHMDARERAARLDLVEFQLGEIERLGPKAGEDDALEAERRILASAERVRDLAEGAYAALYDDEQAALARLADVWRRTEELARIDPAFAPHLEGRDAIKSQLEELAHALRARTDDLDASPARLEAVTARLVALEGLVRKHGPTLADVLARAEALATERALLREGGEGEGRLEQELAAAEERYRAAAATLSHARRTAAGPFAADLERLLADLAMQARFEVRIEEAPADAWGPDGVDRVEFYLSPNPGEEPRALARIASGGELSRVMLALKTLGRAGDVDTLVFDEVDAGIGGRVADVVGGHLRALGEQQQVLCITHLPQIAAHGTIQFRIEKHVRGARTVTAIDALDDAGRVDELARMIGGGAEADAAVRASARELLAHAGGRAKGKQKAKAKGEGGR